MTETENKLGHLLELVFKAFILASVVAVMVRCDYILTPVKSGGFHIKNHNLDWISDSLLTQIRLSVPDLLSVPV